MNLMSSEVECSRWFEIVRIYIESYRERFDPSNSRYWLKEMCRSFYSDKEHVDVTKITNTMCNLKGN